MSMRMAKMLFLAMASMATKWLVGEKQAPEATPTAGELAADEANILELDESDKAIEGSIKEDLLDGLPSRYKRGASDRSIRKGEVLLEVRLEDQEGVMPTEDYQKHEDFDDSAQPGAKRQLVKLVVWWDCKRFRRFSKVLVGFPDPQWIYSVIPLAFQQGVNPYLSTAVMLPEKTWMAHLQRAKQDKAYAEVKNADRDPNINQYESELIKEIGRRVIYNAQGEPMPTLVLPPDNVKHRFNFQ